MNEEQKQTLGQIKAMIDEWRKNKKNPAEKMPDDIWEAIFNLIETAGCPENEILKKIGIIIIMKMSAMIIMIIPRPTPKLTMDLMFIQSHLLTRKPSKQKLKKLNQYSILCFKIK